MEAYLRCKPIAETTEGNKLDDKSEEVSYDPAELLKNYDKIIPKLIAKPMDRKKHKGTNIPKFLLKVFFNNMP